MPTIFQYDDCKIEITSGYGNIKHEEDAREIFTNARFPKETKEYKQLDRESELISEQREFAKDLVYDIKQIIEPFYSKGFRQKEEYKEAIRLIQCKIEDSFFET